MEERNGSSITPIEKKRSNVSFIYFIGDRANVETNKLVGAIERISRVRQNSFVVAFILCVS